MDMCSPIIAMTTSRGMHCERHGLLLYKEDYVKPLPSLGQGTGHEENRPFKMHGNQVQSCVYAVEYPNSYCMVVKMFDNQNDVLVI